MCGICFILSHQHQQRTDNTPNTADGTSCSFDVSPISKRGPDYFGKKDHVLLTASNSSSTTMSFYAAVLSLQKDDQNKLVKMPVEIQKSKLLWNGEVFFGGGEGEGHDQNDHKKKHTPESDTLFIAETLLELENKHFCSSNAKTASFAISKQQFIDEACCFFRSIGGPFAFIYFCGTFVPKNEDNEFVIFGRDVWGRRSLVIGETMMNEQDDKNGGGTGAKKNWIISSTVISKTPTTQERNDFEALSRTAFEKSLPREHLFSSSSSTVSKSDAASPSSTSTSRQPTIKWTELKPDGVYCLDPSNIESDRNSQPQPFYLASKYESVKLSSASCSFIQTAATMNSVRLHPLSDRARFSNHAVILPTSLSTSSLSFSSPSLCVHDDFLKNVMDFTCNEAQKLHQDNQKTESVISSIVSRITEFTLHYTHWGPKQHAEELEYVMKQNFASFISKIIDGERKSPRQFFFSSSSSQKRNIISFTCCLVYMTFLAISVHRRTATWNTNNNSHQNDNNSLRHLLILFSGGIDCVVLAKLTHILTSSSSKSRYNLDLINLAFGKNSNESLSSIDRISSLDSVVEVFRDCRIQKNTSHDDTIRTRLLLADVTGEEILQHSANIASCILPKKTIMDTGIGAALYFAARGEGRVAPEATKMDRVVVRRNNSDDVNHHSMTIYEKIEEFRFCKCEVKVGEDSTPEREDDDDTKSRFLPLLKCLIRHFVDRAVDECEKQSTEMSICLLGKEYTSEELIKTNKIFGYKTLRHQVEAAVQAGLVRLRGVSYSNTTSSIPPTTTLPQIRERADAATTENEDEVSHTDNNKKNQQKEKTDKKKEKPQQCSQSGRDYLISIVDEECLNFALKLRRERLNLAGLLLSSSSMDKNDNIISTTISPSRIIIAGMGADESLGGYHRYCHRNSSNEIAAGVQNDDAEKQKQNQQQQHDRLQEEMQRDFDRLWERNLGRDDRVMSSFGKEARFPFLDELLLFALSGIVSWVENCQSSTTDDNVADDDDEASPTTSSSQTTSTTTTLFKDKNILRLGAEHILGISHDVAFKPKKAIQFGTKIANRKNKGEEVVL